MAGFKFSTGIVIRYINSKKVDVIEISHNEEGKFSFKFFGKEVEVGKSGSNSGARFF